MKFSQTARNQPAPPTAAPVVPAVPGPVTATPNTAASGPTGTAPTDNFVQVLAQSDPQQQKQIIGEQLYRQIYSLHNELAGKITGTNCTDQCVVTFMNISFIAVALLLLVNCVCVCVSHCRDVAGDGQL